MAEPPPSLIGMPELIQLPDLPPLPSVGSLPLPPVGGLPPLPTVGGLPPPPMDLPDLPPSMIADPVPGAMGLPDLTAPAAGLPPPPLALLAPHGPTLTPAPGERPEDGADPAFLSDRRVAQFVRAKAASAPAAVKLVQSVNEACQVLDSIERAVGDFFDRMCDPGCRLLPAVSLRSLFPLPAPLLTRSRRRLPSSRQ